MNGAEIGGLVRTLAASLFGFMAGQGWFDAETGTALAGAVGVIATAAWSIWAKKRAAAQGGAA